MGTPIRDSHFPNDTTPTTLSDYALSQLRYQTFLSMLKLSLILRECDHRANSILKKHSQLEKLSQMPVVLLPLHFDREPYSTKVGPCQRSVVIRYAFFWLSVFEKKTKAVYFVRFHDWPSCDSRRRRFGRMYQRNGKRNMRGQLINHFKFYFIFRFRELQDYFTIWLQSRPARPNGNRHNFKNCQIFFIFICECASNERSFCVYFNRCW